MHAVLEDVEDPAHIAQRAATDLGDTRHRRRRCGRVTGRHPFGRHRLDDHHAERMGDDVVHLASDPSPLFRNGSFGFEDAK